MPEIPLLSRAGELVAVTLVDPVDEEFVAGFTWRLAAGRYAGRWSDGTTLYLHRALFGLERGDPREVDHANRNTLDNRRENLRVVSRAENGQNLPAQSGTSRFRGVCWDRRTGRWSAQVKVAGVKHHLGYFATEELAATVAAGFRASRMPFSEEAQRVAT